MKDAVISNINSISSSITASLGSKLGSDLLIDFLGPFQYAMHLFNLTL